MNAPVCSSLYSESQVPAPPEATKLVIPRDAWAFVADDLRAATQGCNAPWKVQRSAAWIVLPEGSEALHACRGVLSEAGVPVVDVDPTAPQCTACGCVDRVACPSGCRWAGVNRCTRCAGSKAGPRRRANGALMSRRMSRMGRP